MKSRADHHIARSYVDSEIGQLQTPNPKLQTISEPPERFAVGCEGELIDSFADAGAALRFARWSADWCDCPHEIFDGPTGEPICTVQPFTPEAA